MGLGAAKMPFYPSPSYTLGNSMTKYKHSHTHTLTQSHKTSPYKAKLCHNILPPATFSTFTEHLNK